MSQIEDEFTFRYLNLFNLFFAIKKMALSQKKQPPTIRKMLEDVEGDIQKVIQTFCGRLYNQGSPELKDCTKLIEQTITYNQSSKSQNSNISQMINSVWNAFQTNFENFLALKNNTDSPPSFGTRTIYSNSESNLYARDSKSSAHTKKVHPKIVLIGQVGIHKGGRMPPQIPNINSNILRASNNTKVISSKEYVKPQNPIPKKEIRNPKKLHQVQIRKTTTPSDSQGDSKRRSFPHTFNENINTPPRISRNQELYFDSEIVKSMVIEDPLTGMESEYGDDLLEVVSLMDTPQRSDDFYDDEDIDDDNVSRKTIFKKSKYLTPRFQ